MDVKSSSLNSIFLLYLGFLESNLWNYLDTHFILLYNSVV